MRRLRNIYSINKNRPEGKLSVPKVAVNGHYSRSQAFGTLDARDVGSGRTVPGRNVPKGRVVAIWNIVTKYLLEQTYAFVMNPSGRLSSC